MAEKRIALVTGANRGLGREIARKLAGQGAIVAVAARDRGKGEEAAGAIRDEGGEAFAVGLDQTDEKNVAAAVDEIVARHGRIDVLVNNGAILIDSGGWHGSLFELTPETALRTFETNVVGPLNVIKAVAPHMRRQRWGRIVNVSSGAGQLAGMGAGFPAYRMSKTALNALTRIAAAELGEHGILVNACHPGWVRTDMGGAEADLSVEEGADTPVWLATLPDGGPNGGFFVKRRKMDW